MNESMNMTGSALDAMGFNTTEIVGNKTTSPGLPNEMTSLPGPMALLLDDILDMGTCSERCNDTNLCGMMGSDSDREQLCNTGCLVTVSSSCDEVCNIDDDMPSPSRACKVCNFLACCQADGGNFDDCQVHLPMFGIMMNDPPSLPQEGGGVESTIPPINTPVDESGEIDLSESSADMSGSFDSQISFFTFLVTMAAIVFLSRK